VSVPRQATADRPSGGAREQAHFRPGGWRINGVRDGVQHWARAPRTRQRGWLPPTAPGVWGCSAVRFRRVLATVPNSTEPPRKEHSRIGDRGAMVGRGSPRFPRSGRCRFQAAFRFERQPPWPKWASERAPPSDGRQAERRGTRASPLRPRGLPNKPDCPGRGNRGVPRPTIARRSPILSAGRSAATIRGAAVA
jgi:hypothetical protein